MKDMSLRSSSSGLDMSVIEALQDQFEQVSFDCASSTVSDGLSSEGFSRSFGDVRSGEDGSSSTDGSSPLVWTLSGVEKSQLMQAAKPGYGANICNSWDEKGESELSELEMMKEKFSKLLLGEDMSGGGKGVCSALAISNAITNLSASVFGELWRLEPLSKQRKTVWKREMNWLLSVADHIVELVPSLQAFPDGSTFEVMVTRPRSDLHVNLPALRKLDAMLLEALDSFTETEFWYVDQGMADREGHGIPSGQAQEEKWWLPTPKVPVNGLSEEGKKRLQHQRECLSQVLKAALAINSHVLSEMQVPDAYLDALPKSGKASLGETIYKHITSDYFSAEALLCSLDLSTEHKAVGVANRIEAAINVWRRRRQPRNSQRMSRDFKQNGKNSWGIMKDLVTDVERREELAGRAESLLLCLKQRFPGLRQSLLDMTKIQYNKDVGQSILESYSRVLESLAFNIIARIDDVLEVHDMTRRALPPPPPAVKTRIPSLPRHGFSLNVLVHTPFVTPLVSPSASPTPSPTPRRTPNSPFHDDDDSQVLPDYMGFSYELKHNGEINEVSGQTRPPLRP